MTKSTFLSYDKPTLTCMVQADNPDRIEELIRLSIPEGAEAFGMQFCRLRSEYRKRETYGRLFSLTGTRPVYITNYRAGSNEGKGDDVLATELLEMAEEGAALCDVMGDYFDRCEGELTENAKAIEKQMKLIDEVHNRGAEVLMSSHVLRFLPADQVLRIAREHRRRGADISKIVVRSENIEEQIENLRILNILKRELDFPFLFLSVGECGIFRRLSSKLGSCMSLCVYEHDELATKAQPLLRDMRKIRDLLAEC